MGIVSWSKLSQLDLLNIADYIAKDSPIVAINFVEKILTYAKDLGNYPERGRIVPEFDKSNLRELIFQNYRIIYQVSDNKDVNIVTVTHGAMDLKLKYEKEKWQL